MKIEYPDEFLNAISQLSLYEPIEYLPRLASYTHVEAYLKQIIIDMKKEIIDVLRSPNGLAWRETDDPIGEDDYLIYELGCTIKTLLDDLRKPKMKIEYLLDLYERIVVHPEFKINENLILKP